MNTKEVQNNVGEIPQNRRGIGYKVQTWAAAIAELEQIQTQLIKALKTKGDLFFSESLPNREDISLFAQWIIATQYLSFSANCLFK